MFNIEDFIESVDHNALVRKSMREALAEAEQAEMRRISEAVITWATENANANSVLTSEFWSTLFSFKSMSTPTLSGRVLQNNHELDRILADAKLEAAKKVSPQAYLETSYRPKVIVPFVDTPEMKKYITTVLAAQDHVTVHFENKLNITRFRSEYMVGDYVSSSRFYSDEVDVSRLDELFDILVKRSENTQVDA